MEIIIELQGLDQEESFSTFLDEETTLLKVGEMIQEAQFYQSFNLSEQFCLEVKGENKFISGRQTVVKFCLTQNQINTKELIFHKGLDSQTKMYKGIIIDQKFQNQVLNSLNDVKIQLPVQNQQKNQVISQKGEGIKIGGGDITESQHLNLIEQNINRNQQQDNVGNQSLQESGDKIGQYINQQSNIFSKILFEIQLNPQQKQNLIQYLIKEGIEYNIK